MEILVLGPVEVREGDERLPIGGPKQRTILALLVANAGRPVSLQRLVETVHGEGAAPGAARSVQTFISTFRRYLGDAIHKGPGGYTLTVDPETIDVARFERLVESSSPLVEEQPEVAASRLREALAMWRGHPYSDVDGRGELEPEITRLGELRLAALEGRIDADLAASRHRELVGELEALTIEYPLRERFHGQLMLALYRCGRQTEALRAFGRARAYLAEEIGIDPSPPLRHLEQRILEHDPTLDPVGSPPITLRAVAVVDVADASTMAALAPEDRAARVATTIARLQDAVARHSGLGPVQRGSALYASFDSVTDAVAAVVDTMPDTWVDGLAPRAAIDLGDVELHESGAVSGLPVRRSAALVAAGHPGQVLVSADAHRAITTSGTWQARTLGSHHIVGWESEQQVSQLVLPGVEREYPPLLIDVEPLPLPTPRHSVAAYELRRPLATDQWGTTYRAYQPMAGREVTVRVIDPVWANRGDFISLFEVETQLVARLNHPHIIPLLDSWRDPTGAFMVSPPVGSRTLTDAISAGDLDAPTRVRVVEEVAAALAHAHKLGIVHGIVSPDVVMLDDSHHAYLAAAGFVARLAGVTRSTSGHDAAPALPDDPPTTAGDVYALGCLAHALVVDGAAIPSLRNRVGDVIARATSDQGGDRFVSADDFLTALRRAAGDETPMRFTPARNPYKGLEAFGEADAADFFGRQDAVEELVDLVADRPLVAVVGPSGSGKSSLVKAGLIPAVRAGAVDGNTGWVVAEMLPGPHPLEELVSALTRVAVTTTDRLIEELNRDDGGLVRALRRLLPEGKRLLLVIDQFEELFTLTRDEEARQRLLGALLALAADDRATARVVITIRADFFDRPLQHPEFGALIKNGVYPLTTPSDSQLSEAILQPASAVGVGFEAGLPERIVADLRASPGTLPLLQYTLTQLFAARHSDQVTHGDYADSGGVMGALATRADEVFDRLEPGLHLIASQVFLRLVTVQASGEVTRRRVRVLELNAIAEPHDIDAVLTAFGDARLLTFDHDPVSRGPTVEVAHEALLSRWPRLASWIDAAHEDLLLHRKLSDAVQEWEERDRSDGYLPAEAGLARFEAWAGNTSLSLTHAELEYLRTARLRAERQRTRRRNARRAVTAGFAAAAVIAGILAFQAAESAEVAESRALAASAINVLDEDPELSVLLALEAARIADPPFESVAALHESLANHKKIFTYQWPIDRAAADLSTRISPDGSLLVATAGTRYVEVVDIDSGDRLWEREFPESAIVRATFTPDGSGVVATVGWTRPTDGSDPDPDLVAELGAHTLDARTGSPIGHVATGPCGVATGAEVLDVAGGPAGMYLVAEVEGGATCSFRGSTGPTNRPPIALIDLSSGNVEVITEEQEGVYAAADGRRLIKPVVDDTAPSDEASDSAEPTFLTGVAGSATGPVEAVLPGLPLAISDAGKIVMTGWTDEDQILTWDVSSGAVPQEPLARINTMRGTYTRGIYVWLSPDGGTIARSLESAGVDLFDARTGALTDHLLTGLGSNERLSFNADGTRVAVGELFGGRAVVFDRTSPSELGLQQLCPAFISSFAAVEVRGGVGAVLAGCVGESGSSTHVAVDAASLKVRTQVPRQTGVRGALSHDGRLIAGQAKESTESRFFIRDSLTGAIARELQPFADWSHDLEFSPDASLLALAGESTDAVTVWDVAGGRITASAVVPHLTTGPDRVLDVEFSPDGERLAATFVWTPKELWLISTENWKPITHYQPPETATNDEAPANNLQFTPDGSTLVASDFNSRGEGRIVLMDGVTLEHLGDIPDAHRGGVADLALNEDGSLLASAGLDGVVRVWDMATHRLLHEVPVSREPPGVGGVAFAGNDRHLLVTAMGDGTLRKVTIDTAELLDIARARVTRTFTDSECAVYRIDPCPTLEQIHAG